MKISPLALKLVLSSSMMLTTYTSYAFTTTTSSSTSSDFALLRSSIKLPSIPITGTITTALSMSSDDDGSSSSSSSSSTGNRLDALSNEYGITVPSKLSSSDDDEYIPDNVSQPLTEKERVDNLTAIRNLHKVEIEDAKRYSNYEGFVKGKRKLKERRASDPWFGINDALRRAVTMGEDDEAERLKKLVEQVGGPPTGVAMNSGKPYATFDEVFDTGITGTD